MQGVLLTKAVPVFKVSMSLVCGRAGKGWVMRSACVPRPHQHAQQLLSLITA